MNLSTLKNLHNDTEASPVFTRKYLCVVDCSK